MTSPTQRALEYFRKQGWHAGVTEKWNPYAGPMRDGKPVGIRQDLFGFVDLVLIAPEHQGTTFVQVSSVGGLSARIKKVLEDDRMRLVASDMLLAHNRLWFMGWRKVGRFWQPTIREASVIEQAPIRIINVMRDGILVNPSVWAMVREKRTAGMMKDLVKKLSAKGDGSGISVAQIKQNSQDFIDASSA